MSLGTYRNAFSLPGISEVHDGHRGAASEPYTMGDDNEIICRTVHCECGEVFTAFIGEFFDDRLSHAKELKEFSFIVTVEAASVDEAVQVMSERINHDEEYGFDYTIEWNERASHDPLMADVWDDGWKAAQDVVDFEGEKVWVHQVLDSHYMNPHRRQNV